MDIEKFNQHPKHLKLVRIRDSETKTKQEWLQFYIFDRQHKYKNPEEMIKELVPTLF